jgi:hypothetical protein
MNNDNIDNNNTTNYLKKECLILKGLPKTSDSNKEKINPNISDQLGKNENFNENSNNMNNLNNISCLTNNYNDFNIKNLNVSNNLQLFLNNCNVNVMPYNSYDNYLKSMNVNLFENSALNMCYNNRNNNLGTSTNNKNIINTHQPFYNNINNPSSILQGLMNLNNFNNLNKINNFNYSTMYPHTNNNLYSSNQLDLYINSLLNSNDHSNNIYRNFQGYYNNPLFVKNSSSDNKLIGVSSRENVNNQNVLNSQSYPTSKDNLIDVLKSSNSH